MSMSISASPRARPAALEFKVSLDGPTDPVSLEHFDQTAMVDQNGHSYNAATVDLLRSQVPAGNPIISPYTRSQLDPARIQPNFQLRETTAFMEQIHMLVTVLTQQNASQVRSIAQLEKNLKASLEETASLRKDLRTSEQNLKASLEETASLRRDWKAMGTKLHNSEESSKASSAALKKVQFEVDLCRAQAALDRVTIEKQRKMIANAQAMGFVDHVSCALHFNSVDKIMIRSAPGEKHATWRKI
jgi:hypothetical protein